MTKQTKQTAVQELKSKFLKLRSEAKAIGITRSDFLGKVMREDSDYCSTYGIERLTRVWQGLTADLELTEMLQKMISDSQKVNSELKSA